MSIDDTIRALDDAREHYARIKGIDKLARWLILGSLAVMTGALAVAIAIDNGRVPLLLIPAALAFGGGLYLWSYVNLRGDLGRGTDRLAAARSDLRDAERAHVRATLGGDQ